jgi:hypothetical protein
MNLHNINVRMTLVERTRYLSLKPDYDATRIPKESRPFWTPCETLKRGPTPSNPAVGRRTRQHSTSPPPKESNASFRFPHQANVPPWANRQAETRPDRLRFWVVHRTVHLRSPICCPS